jgi:protein-tyrosine phosphatase
MNQNPRVSVLFVCMGNICRSPTAHGMFQQVVAQAGLADQILIDSAGTHDYHVGEPPDPRARATALRRGIDLGAQRARQVTETDLVVFDYIVAMDGQNLANLKGLCPPGHEHKLTRFLDFVPEPGTRDVPDPYYGGPRGFELVLDLVEAAARGLLADIRARHGL